MENVMDIEWQEGAVCFANGKQWRYLCNGGADTLLIDRFANGARFDYFLMRGDFQLNTIKQGDYIEALELDTEQKYNDAVEVLGLFGFYRFNSYEYKKTKSDFDSGAKRLFLSFENYIMTSPDNGSRKITFNQLMAIGELKRLMNEREKPSRKVDVSCDNERLTKDELIRLMNERESNHSAKPNSSVSKVNRDIDAFKDGNKYHREIIGLDGTKTIIDVYRVLDAFKTGCSATDHAIKKILCAGLRGHKDKLTDYDNAIESLEQAKALLIQKGVK
jgi:hypothetical protein